MADKDPAAVALGRRGGLARAARLSADERRAAGLQAAQARWAKKPLDTPSASAEYRQRMGRGAIYRKVWNLRPAFESPWVAELSLEALAEKLGCSRSHLYRLQKGTRTPSRVIAERLADAAKMPVGALILGAVGPDTESEATAQEFLGRREDGRVR